MDHPTDHSPATAPGSLPILPPSTGVQAGFPAELTHEGLLAALGGTVPPGAPALKT